MIKRWLIWLLKGGISLGLTGWVLSSIDLSAAWDEAKSVSLQMALLALTLTILQVVIGAARWGLVLRALATPFGWVQTLSVYYIGIFFSVVLPGAVGGDAARMWFARRHGLPLSVAVNSVGLERLATVFALILLVCLTQPILMVRLPDLPGAWLFPLLLVAGIFGTLALAFMDRLPQTLHRWQVVRGLAALAADTRRLFFRPAYSLSTIFAALIGHVISSLCVYVLAVGLGLDVHVLDCLVLVPPVILMLALPISIAGWGVRETAMVTAFGFVGVTAPSALVLSVLFGVISTLTALPGGALFLLSDGRRADRKDHSPEV